MMSEVHEHRHYYSAYGSGGLLALVLSALLNKSFILAFLHMLCGWLYVLYACIERWPEIRAILRSIG